MSDDPGEDRVNAEDNALAEDDGLAADNVPTTFSRETIFSVGLSGSSVISVRLQKA